MPEPPPLESCVEQLLSGLVGLLDQRGDVVVVVLERAVALRSPGSCGRRARSGSRRSGATTGGDARGGPGSTADRSAGGRPLPAKAGVDAWLFAALCEARPPRRRTTSCLAPCGDPENAQYDQPDGGISNCKARARARARRRGTARRRSGARSAAGVEKRLDRARASCRPSGRRDAPNVAAPARRRRRSCSAATGCIGGSGAGAFGTVWHGPRRAPRARRRGQDRAARADRRRPLRARGPRRRAARRTRGS